MRSPRQTGASTDSVGGQRSDVIKIIRVNPTAGTITILSIPRDTEVTLLANQALYGNYNRINVNYANGPALLVQTIKANFGITINHVVQVNFNGLINSADAIGGVYLDFRYPAIDPNSGLEIKHPGCQLVNRLPGARGRAKPSLLLRAERSSDVAESQGRSPT